MGQDMPGKREVGSTVLPAWVTIADADFDAVFRADEDEGTCTDNAPTSTITTCPGNLQKYLHPLSGKFLCAPPYATALRAEGAYSFFVSLPTDAHVAGFRGRVVAVARGAMDGFLNASYLPLDFSSAACADAAQCGTGFGGSIWDDARVRASGCAEGVSCSASGPSAPHAPICVRNASSAAHQRSPLVNLLFARKGHDLDTYGTVLFQLKRFPRRIYGRHVVKQNAECMLVQAPRTVLESHTVSHNLALHLDLQASGGAGSA